VLAGDADRGAAGGQHRGRGHPPQQIGQHLVDADEMLQVVEGQEGRLLPDPFGDPGWADHRGVDDGGDRVDDVADIADRRQRDPPGGSRRLTPSSQLQRQPGLADPGDPGQRDQPDRGRRQDPGQRTELGVATHQRHQRRGDRALVTGAASAEVVVVVDGERDELPPLGAADAQRLGQRTDRRQPRGPHPTALDVADGPDAHPGQLGQPLLRQRCRLSSGAQHVSERCPLARRVPASERSHRAQHARAARRIGRQARCGQRYQARPTARLTTATATTATYLASRRRGRCG
jgi:hypothetical protein